MQITLEIPEELAAKLLPPGKDPAREALELLAIEGYSTERLSEEEVRLMLGLDTRMQVHALLKEHGACLHYSLADFEQDRETSRRLREALSPVAVPLAVNGKPEAILQDPAAYQRLLDLAAEADPREGIRQGLQELRQGEGRPAAEFIDEMRASHGIPR